MIQGLEERLKNSAVIKLRGSAISRGISETGLALVLAKNTGKTLLVFHGGKEQASSALEKAGFETKFVDGYRFTTPEMMPFVERAYRDLNSRLVQTIKGYGKKCFGMKGSELIAAESMGEKYGGSVGVPTGVNQECLELLEKEGRMIIISCIGSGKGELFNINADIAAGFVAATLRSPNYLVIIKEAGILRDPSKQDSVIPKMTLAELNSMELEGGMLPKRASIDYFLNNGGSMARVLNIYGLASALCGQERGTKIVRQG
ncbi:hypothetical protein JXB11_02740 [Candidatus Woesearchaeota archaeon]|nr:hypothetical protein [Candidatus Woesearchaeota archaeon]